MSLSKDDSLTPPYPSFGEFIRGELTKYSASELTEFVHHSDGRKIGESAVNSWASGNAPGTNLHPEIRSGFGYDFGERSFCEAAMECGFPHENAAEEIKAIRTSSKLRAHLAEMVKSIQLEALSNFFGLKSASTLYNFYTKDKSLSKEFHVLILRRLHEVPAHMSGKVLSGLTPKRILAGTLRACRLQSGMDRKAFAKKLGFDVDYLRYLEEIADAAEGGAAHKGGSANPERYKSLCEKLMKERARLGVTSGDADVPDEDVEPRTDSPSAPAANLATPALEAPGEVKQLRDEVRRLSERLTALERQMRESPSAPVSAKATSYGSDGSDIATPFRKEAWRTHDHQVDAGRLHLVQTLVQVLIQELGFLAQVSDDAKRTEIREAIKPLLVVELLGAIEAFSQVVPSAALKIIASWRAFQKEGVGT